MNLQLSVPDGSPAFDRFFRQHYEIIKKWARHVTGNDEGLFEDIVHDVYVRFREQRIETLEIRSVEAYIFMTLKNDFISNRRKESRSRAKLIPLDIDDISADTGFADDPFPAINAADQLRAICHYACGRRFSSISASLFLLRFFHGYFTFEVARMAQRSTNAVEARLLKMRREVRLYLNEPNQFSGISSDPGDRQLGFRNGEASSDLLTELRQQIFGSCDGVCLSESKLVGFYTDHQPVDRAYLGHLVSCRKCLERINEALGLPRLSVRHPLETLRINELERPDPIEIKVARAAA